MGKIKYINKIREFFRQNPVVNIGSLKKFLDKKNKEYVYLIVNNLIKRGEIRKITRGFYTIYEEPSLIVFCFKPSYLGLQDALSFHNLWEQETNPVIITVKKARQGSRKVFGNNAFIKRISGKYFFGFEYAKQGGFYFPYSDIEKTFIDMVYFKQPMDEDVLNELRKRANKKKLREYLKKYPQIFQDKVKKRLKGKQENDKNE